MLPHRPPATHRLPGIMVKDNMVVIMAVGIAISATKAAIEIVTETAIGIATGIEIEIVPKETTVTEVNAATAMIKASASPSPSVLSGHPKLLRAFWK